jgi:hypothetical protein
LNLRIQELELAGHAGQVLRRKDQPFYIVSQIFGRRITHNAALMQGRHAIRNRNVPDLSRWPANGTSPENNFVETVNVTTSGDILTVVGAKLREVSP